MYYVENHIPRETISGELPNAGVLPPAQVELIEEFRQAAYDGNLPAAARAHGALLGLPAIDWQNHFTPDTAVQVTDNPLSGRRIEYLRARQAVMTGPEELRMVREQTRHLIEGEVATIGLVSRTRAAGPGFYNVVVHAPEGTVHVDSPFPRGVTASLTDEGYRDNSWFSDDPAAVTIEQPVPAPEPGIVPQTAYFPTQIPYRMSRTRVDMVHVIPRQLPDLCQIV